MYTIHWRSKLTGETGNGSVPLPKEVAELWIEKADKNFVYWLVKVS